MLRRTSRRKVGRFVDSAAITGQDRVREASRPLSTRTTISVIVPVLDEEGSLPKVLRDLPDFVHEVIVVDGLSCDNSVEVARRVRPDCHIVLEKKKGKGTAMRAGLSAATSDYIIFLDADYSHNPREIRQMIERLEEGYDLVHGSRFMPGGGSADLTPFRFLGNKLFVWLTNFLHGTNYTDVCYGYIGFRRDALTRLPLVAKNMEIEPDVLVSAHKAGLRMIEVPSFERRRYSGHSKLNVLRDGWRIFWRIVGYRFGGRSLNTGASHPQRLEKEHIRKGS